MASYVGQDEVDTKKFAEALKQYLCIGVGVQPLPKLEATASVEPNSLYYKMDHKSRGIALIFNHYTYTARVHPVTKESYKHKNRDGTDADALVLIKTLTSFGFSVTTYNDKKRNEIEEILKNASKLDHSEHDSLVIVVLTHGNERGLSAEDKDYPHEILWNDFTADNCVTLAGKPKLLIIQACRGELFDNGTLLKTPSHQSRTAFDSPSKIVNWKPYEIPNQADFLICFSSPPGYFSWRNENTGSVFIQNLCSALTMFSSKMDLLSLLTLVNLKVGIEFKSQNSSREKSGKKIVPQVSHTLMRQIHLGAPREVNNQLADD